MIRGTLVAPRCRIDVPALLLLCLLAGSARADELPTIASELPPALRIAGDGWGVRIERVTVAIRSAPEPTFVTLEVATGREQTVVVPLDVPAGTRVVGLGSDGPEGRAWGRALPRAAARDRQRGHGGAVLAWDGTSADEDHLTLTATAPATIELALYLPPLPRLAIETTARVLGVDVDGARQVSRGRRAVVELADVAGRVGELALASASERVALVAAPASVFEFLEHPPSTDVRFGRDLDKAMIRRRLKWLRPHLRRCFMQAAQGSALRRGGAVLAFLIVADGSVAWARAHESDLPATVDACLVAQVERLELPAADGDVLVHYPVEFRANE